MKILISIPFVTFLIRTAYLFDLGSGIIERNGVKVPVFEASAADKDVLYGIDSRFDTYIDQHHKIQVGSLTEPKISGNWQ